MDTYIGLCPGHCTGDKKKIELYRERLSEARDFLLGKQEAIMQDLQNKMKTAAQERRYEDAAEYKNLISQIESAGSRQIVRDAISGNATVVVTLEKYNHLFISFIEVKNSMIVGVHEYKLANPLEETHEELTSQAILQHLAEEPSKILYTDIDYTSMKDLQKYVNSENIQVKEPSR